VRSQLPVVVEARRVHGARHQLRSCLQAQPSAGGEDPVTGRRKSRPA
jgi:hypothetical protein